MSHARSRSTIGESSLLSIGFLALTGAVLAAHSAPATGYELSLYTSTPLSFWALFGCAMSISLLVSLEATTDWYRRLALGLGGGASMAFIGLPVLRGYRFYGAGDALTHLGWVRGIRAGNLQPTELFYPGLHTLSTFIGVTFDIDLTQATLLAIVLFSALFVLFVSLSTALVFESRYSTIVGAFSALLFLPITNMSMFIVAHPMSQAVLFSAVVIYLLLRYLRSQISLFSSSAIGAILTLTSVGLTIYHPQLAAHMVVVFLGIAMLQYLARWRWTDHPIASHRPIYGQTVILAAAFLLWISNHGFFADVITFAFSNVIQYFVGSGPAAAGGSVGSQSGSLQEIGASVGELFLKMFGMNTLYIVLTGLLFLYLLFKSDAELVTKTNGLVSYFVVSLVGLTGLFGLYFFGNVSEMYFRVFGLMMAFITITGAVAISYGMTHVSKNRPTPIFHSFSVTVFLVLLFVSLLTVFPSPYMYNASPHVTEMSMSGHETAFENRAENVSFIGIRAGPNRYLDATRAQRTATDGHDGSITGSEIEDDISDQYNTSRYLTVTRNDYEREVSAYQELRYSRDQLASISSQQGVNRVQSNGEFNLYFIRGE